MKKLWTSPDTIHVVEVLNNRELNSDYIGSLAESMQLNGYLAEYPIEVFESANVPAIQTDKPYLCACGAHRTHAALLAELEQVFCIIHDGNEEDWIERMSLDNFQFDVAENSALGQPFTQKEKRAACTQLLFLPKYLKLTNTALAELWHVQESTVRNWRKKVESQICDESPDLNDFHISEGRLDQLKAVVASPERETPDGETIKVRGGKTDEEKRKERSDFYMSIREDAGWWSDDWLEEQGIEWGDVKEFIAQEWNLSDSWQASDISMQRLRQLHNWILSDDAEFIAGCQEMAKVREADEKVKKELDEACDACQSALIERFCPGKSRYSDEFSTVKSVFAKAAAEQGFKDFSLNAYHYEGTENKLTATDNLKAILKAIEEDADWILAFEKQMEKAGRANRKKTLEAWEKARSEMQFALKEYPRDIPHAAFYYAFDDKFYEKPGTCLRMMNEKPSKRRQLEGIKNDIDHFKRATKDLKADEKWIRQIPERASVPENGQPVSPVEVDPEVANSLFFVKLIWNEGDGQKTQIFETKPFQGSKDVSELPDSLRQQLVALAKEGTQ